jgi:hypothetical protein
VTHETDQNVELQNDPLFELGIHPNFLLNSSHGKTSNEVLDYCLGLVPNAMSSRSHSLATNEPVLQQMCEEYGIKNDCSLFLPDTPRVYPHEIVYSERQIKLTRWPHFFQDNMFMFRHSKTWNLKGTYFQKGGLKIYNFHPIHIALNSENFSNYNLLKENIGLSNFKFQDKDLYRNSINKV